MLAGVALITKSREANRVNLRVAEEPDDGCCWGPHLFGIKLDEEAGVRARCGWYLGPLPFLLSMIGPCLPQLYFL